MDKKRVIKSYEKLDQAMKDLLLEAYPSGFTGNVIRLTNAQNETYFAVPLETEEANYLIKVPLESMKSKATPADDDDDDGFDAGADDVDEVAGADDADDADDSSSDPSYNQGFDDDID
ncbi:hypothetical protein [Imperialibacter roseus]|uniref:Uncharacterized protein n=1 Tax=Imperialibacter roseus TaxID=1324217 RepID=A0ABZ0J059_9BACT|nr:hypothetical protein [Imperialibacter roseus]WOK09321.1 hypothetical protein RT717_11795 [Imperialibacter roseus]|tara:strand:+ start:1654 stop:2007 length:354 start_codon:yes stop_codon:yes gene_type:complete